MIAATDNLTMPFHYYDMISGEREYDGGFNWEKFLTTVQVVQGCVAFVACICFGVSGVNFTYVRKFDWDIGGYITEATGLGVTMGPFQTASAATTLGSGIISLGTGTAAAVLHYT